MEPLSEHGLKAFLDRQATRFNTVAFISGDPISVPHRFTLRQDREIAGFLTALLSWGNRTAILRSATRLMELMDWAPLEFVLRSSPAGLQRLATFSYRTFNGDDALFLMAALRSLYDHHGTLEPLFATAPEEGMAHAIHTFRNALLQAPHLPRSQKHLADPLAGSAAKRINMFLRWMVRRDNCGVDFGIWNTLPPSCLVCPLDLHTGNTARRLGLLSRRRNDWRAAEELTERLCQFDSGDPVRYDFALFGLGITRRYPGLEETFSAEV